jgi:hypothetical protein
MNEISWLLPNGPELAGFAVRILVSAETNDRHRSISAELSLAQESRFPETKQGLSQVKTAVRLEGYSAASPSIWR